MAPGQQGAPDTGTPPLAGPSRGAHQHPSPSQQPSPPAPLTSELTTLAYKAGATLSRNLPEFVVSGIGRGLGLAMAQVSDEKRSMVERHLRRVLGPAVSPARLRRLSTQAFDSYARYWVESFRLPDLSRAEVDAGMAVEGYAHVEQALADGTGCIIALPHLGGWEWAGRWTADLGNPITVIVEPLEPPELFEWFRSLRSRLGMNVVPLGPEAGAASARALRHNEVLCLLCDRDVGGGGVEVEFFGETTRLPAGAATLALRTGAPILPAAVYYRGNVHHGVVRPPLAAVRTSAKLRDDIARITQNLAHELELLIRTAPEQWHLFQPNWPSDPGYRG